MNHNSMNNEQDNIISLALLGHQKCGTRYIMQAIKESNLFNIISRKDIDFQSTEPLESRDKTNYKYIYADHPTALSQKIPIYSLKEFYPNMKALVIYRNPIDVMISMHIYLRVGMKKFSGKSIDAGLYKEKPITLPYLSNSKIYHSLMHGELRKIYEERFRYDLNAITLRENFKDGDFMEIMYEDFVSDNQKYFTDICRFIGVKNFTLPRNFINVSYLYKSAILHYVMNYLFFKTTGLDSKYLIESYANKSMRKSLYFYIYRLNEMKPNKILSDIEYQNLKDFYEPMVKDFGRTTKMDISKWGY